MLDEDVLAEVERRAAAAGVEVDVYLNSMLRRHLRMADPDSAAPPTLEVQRDAYLQALLDRNAPRAREVAEAVVSAGVPIPDVYAEIFAPALRAVGHMWALDQLNVAQEHYATSVTSALIATLAAEGPAGEGQGRLAVVTSTPDELHNLGVHMVCDILHREGWEVLNLGASTPAGDLLALVEAEVPDLVALSATTAGRLPGVHEVLTALGALDPKPLVAVGGGLFSGRAGQVARELGADLVVTDVRDLVACLHERFPPLD